MADETIMSGMRIDAHTTAALKVIGAIKKHAASQFRRFAGVRAGPVIKRKVANAARRIMGFRASALIKSEKTATWQTKEGTNSFMLGSDPAKSGLVAYIDRIVNDLFLKYCPKGARVLDVGCGHGIVSIFLARNGCRVTATDVSQALLDELATSKGTLEVESLQADAYNLPFAEATFDVVVARMFLPHFPDWPTVLKEMARCCRTGGRLVIHFTSKENSDLARRECRQECDFSEVESLPEYRRRPGPFFAAVDRRSIDRVCSRLGLRVLERAPVTFFHHNRLIGRALGSGRFSEYRKELASRLTNPDVMEFAVWLDEEVFRSMPAWISYYNILVLEKA